MKKDAPIVGYIVAVTGIALVTIGHYADHWPLGYALAMIAGIASAMIFDV